MDYISIELTISLLLPFINSTLQSSFSSPYVVLQFSKIDARFPAKNILKGRNLKNKAKVWEELFIYQHMKGNGNE